MEDDWWDLISHEEKADIEEGIKQADSGDLIPNAVVMAQYDKWRLVN